MDRLNYVAREPEFHRGRQLFSLFNGHDVERWLLKWLCGMVYSGNAMSFDGKIEGWRPPVEWLEILFGTRGFPPRWGIYATNSAVGSTVLLSKVMHFAPILSSTIVGGIFGLVGHEFVLAMTDNPRMLQIDRIEQPRFHPRWIQIAIAGRTENLWMEYLDNADSFDMQMMVP